MKRIMILLCSLVLLCACMPTERSRSTMCSWVFCASAKRTIWSTGFWFPSGSLPARSAVRKRSERSDVQNYDSFNPLLIINAVDGSIIDPWVGY